jgi:hypothetical protein
VIAHAFAVAATLASHSTLIEPAGLTKTAPMTVRATVAETCRLTARSTQCFGAQTRPVRLIVDLRGGVTIFEF